MKEKQSAIIVDGNKGIVKWMKWVKGFTV